MISANDLAAATAAFARAGFTPDETAAWLEVGINRGDAEWLRGQGVTTPEHPDVAQFRALTRSQRYGVIASGKTLAEWAGAAVLAAAAAEKSAAAAEKRRATLAAKKAAGAELDRRIAIDAGYPQTSALLASIKPGLLKKAAIAPLFVHTGNGGYAVLTPAGRAVGDVIHVALKDGNQKASEITRLTRLSARSGKLWDLATVEDPAVAQQRRDQAAAAKAAAERAAAQKTAAIAAARAAEAAKLQAAAEAEAATREMTKNVAAVETERVAGMSDDDVRAEVHHHALKRISRIIGADAPPETIAAVERVADYAVASADTAVLRLAAVDTATAVRMGVTRTPGVLEHSIGLARNVAGLRHLIAEGRLDLTVQMRRRRIDVDARWVAFDGDWAILAATDAVTDTVTVTRSGGEAASVSPEATLPLGEGLTLVTHWTAA